MVLLHRTEFRDTFPDIVPAVYRSGLARFWRANAVHAHLPRMTLDSDTVIVGSVAEDPGAIGDVEGRRDGYAL